MNRTSRRRAFMLLEVILSLAILALASAVVMRAYTVSMKTIQKSEIITVATFLAESLVEEMDLRGWKSGRQEGNFGERFPEYYWAAKVEERRLSYNHVGSGVKADDLEPLQTIEVAIYYQRGDHKPYSPLRFSYHPLRLEAFSSQAKFENQLF